MDLHDDDISILQGFDSSNDVSGYYNVSNSCIPDRILPSSAPSGDTALFALQTAYSDLKKRYNDLAVKNQTLSRTLRDVEKLHTAKMTSSPYNDVNCPLSYNSQGAAAMAEEPPAPDPSDLGAQKGFIRYLQRELLNAKTQIKKFESVKASYNENLQKMQAKYKECIEEDSKKAKEISDLQQRLTEMETENQTLKEQLNDCRSQLVKCQNQLQEAEKKIGHGQMSNHDNESRMAARIKQLEEECVRQRIDGEIAQTALVDKDREIEELHNKMAMLEEQNRSQAESMSLVSIPANDELMQLKKIIAGLKRTVYEQNVFLTKFVKSSSLFDPGRSPTKRQAMMCNDEVDNMLCDVITSPRGYGRKNSPDSSIMEDSPHLRVNLPPQVSRHPEKVVPGPTTRQHVPHGTRSEVFNRRPSPTTQTEHSRSEVILRIANHNDMSLTEPYGRGELYDHWPEETNLDSSYDNAPAVPKTEPRVSQNANTTGGKSPDRLNGPGYEIPERHNFFRTNSSGYERQNASGYTTPQRQNAVGYDLSQRQTGPGYNSQQNRPDSDMQQNYGFAYGKDVTSSNGSSSPRATDNTNRDASTQRQDSTRVCPVCSADFSHYSMDEFQTHVFECFDDSDAPETLHAEQPTTSKDRICPMCSALFPENVPQQEFEAHVQTHFEDGANTGFEIIEP